MIENLSQIHVKRHSKTERKELCFVEIEVCHYHERCEKKVTKHLYKFIIIVKVKITSSND